MTNKFPIAKIFTSQVISKTRTAIYENGECICQLRPNEVDAWLFRAQRATVKHASDEAAITLRRIEIALEYLAERVARNSAVAQLSLF